MKKKIRLTESELTDLIKNLVTETKRKKSVNEQEYLPTALETGDAILTIVGTTIGLFCLIINAVPFLPGAKGVVVPCGKVITQLFSSALVILRVSTMPSPVCFSPDFSFHALFTVMPPANVKILVIQLLCMVIVAAT